MIGESCQKYGGEQPVLVLELLVPHYDKKIGVRLHSLWGIQKMKLSHLSVLVTLCAFTPSIASAITITSASQLAAALKTAKGGEVFDLAPGNYGTLSIANRTFSSPITFRSANTSQPATFAQTSITGSKGVNFDGVEFANPLSSGQPSWTAAVRISGSSTISFNNVAVHGSLDNNTANDGYGIHSRSSSNITVTNSNFTQLYRAVLVESNQNVNLTGNVVSNVRSEGFNFADAQNVTIVGNSFSNFHPILPGDHPDAIQFWTAGTTRASSNITISDNLIVGSAGGRMQGIFITSTVGVLPYKNVTITNNTLVGTMWHGITVMEASGVAITGNTVVTQQDAVFKTAWIQVSRVQGVLSGNSAKAINVLNSPDVKSLNNTLNTVDQALADALILAWVNAHTGSATAPTNVTTPTPVYATIATGNTTITTADAFTVNLPTPTVVTDTSLSITPINQQTTQTGFDQVSNTNTTQTQQSTSGNVMSAVPEPATWAQLLLGFGMVGWLMRRGRDLPRVAVG